MYSPSRLGNHEGSHLSRKSKRGCNRLACEYNQTLNTANGRISFWKCATRLRRRLAASHNMRPRWSAWPAGFAAFNKHKAMMVFARGFEANPAERKPERYRCCEDTSPGKEPMRRPARLRPAFDEALQHHIVPENPGQSHQVSRKLAWLGSRKTCQPRNQYSRVGGRRSHMA